MAIIRHHPDGIVYIKDGALQYIDTLENFNIDYGQPMPPLPGNTISRYYSTNGYHKCSDGESELNQNDADVIETELNDIIGSLPLLINKKQARENPPPSEAQKRLTKKQEIIDHAQTLFFALNEKLTWDRLEFLNMISPAINTAALAPDVTQASNIFNYAATKLVFCESGTISLVEAYDPTKDAGWP